MGFLFLLSAGVCIAFAFMLMRKRRVDSVFAAAAKTLGLSWVSEGLLSVKPWIYGFWGGRRIDVRPFQTGKDPVNPLWTGYRVSFQKPVEMSFGGPQDPRRRALAKMSELFRESEVDADGLFCARASLPQDAAILVKEINFLVEMAKLFEQAAPVEPESEREISPEAVVVPVTPPPLPRPNRPERVMEAVPETPDSDLNEPEPGAPALPMERELTPVELAVIDLFGRGRNRYETGRHFASTYQCGTLEGRGWLRKVARFANDRIFGRGPGCLAEIQISIPAADGSQAVNAWVTLELSPPPDPDDRDRLWAGWRARAGAEVQITGVAIHCDPFSRKVFLRGGELIDAEAGRRR